jgi:hypothetical protein
MHAPDCTYCTARAVGVDDDGEPTCGAATCTPQVGPLPAVIECPDEDGDEEQG